MTKVDNWSFEMDNVKPEHEYDICACCQFLSNEDYPDGRMKGMVCHNEDSKHYGEVIPIEQYRNWKCKDFTPHRYKEMSLKEALKIITMPDGHRGTYTSYKCPDSDNIIAIISLGFESNKVAADWRDAYTRLFMEWMEMAENDGDFTDDTEE